MGKSEMPYGRRSRVFEPPRLTERHGRVRFGADPAPVDRAAPQAERHRDRERAVVVSELSDEAQVHRAPVEVAQSDGQLAEVISEPSAAHDQELERLWH